MSLTESYMGLVTSQHRDKPQYTAMLDAVLQYSEDVFSCAITIDDEFDLIWLSEHRKIFWVKLWRR